MDFLFHKVSEKEREEIRKQAKKIVDDFSNTLKGTSQFDKVKGKVEGSFVEIGEGQRAPQAYPETFPKEMFTKGKEGEIECNKFNRKTFFENASEKQGDFIVGEVKKWN